MAPLNQMVEAVFHVPVPPVPAAAPLTSHVRFACARAGAATARIASNAAAAQRIRRGQPAATLTEPRSNAFIMIEFRGRCFERARDRERIWPALIAIQTL